MLASRPLNSRESFSGEARLPPRRAALAPRQAAARFKGGGGGGGGAIQAREPGEHGAFGPGEAAAV